MNALKKAVAGLALVSAAYAPLAGAQWTLDQAVPGSPTTGSTMSVSFTSILDGVQLDIAASGFLPGRPAPWVRDFFFNLPSGWTTVTSAGGSAPAPTITFSQSSGTSAGVFDVLLAFPNASGSRFTSGENALIKVAGVSVPSFNTWENFSIKGYYAVANLGPGNPFIAAVPEPETYAMMIAGLALMGWMARRRRQSLHPEPV